MRNKNASGHGGKFTSSVGFVLAAVGSAVGMGNIWLFPYRVGQYGGGAFLVPYFILVALFSYAGLSGEFALGRLTGTGTMGSFDYALGTRGKKGGRYIGVLPLLGVLVALPLALFLITGALGNRAGRESLSLAEQSIRRAAVQCYALEGAYPRDLSDLEERYGVSVDRERYFVDYRYVASNLMPDITVLPIR